MYGTQLLCWLHGCLAELWLEEKKGPSTSLPAQCATRSLTPAGNSAPPDQSPQVPLDPRSPAGGGGSGGSSNSTAGSSSGNGSSLSKGGIAGIVIGSVVGALLLAAAVTAVLFRKRLRSSAGAGLGSSRDASQQAAEDVEPGLMGKRGSDAGAHTINVRACTSVGAGTGAGRPTWLMLWHGPAALHPLTRQVEVIHAAVMHERRLEARSYT